MSSENGKDPCGIMLAAAKLGKWSTVQDIARLAYAGRSKRIEGLQAIFPLWPPFRRYGPLLPEDQEACCRRLLFENAIFGSIVAEAAAQGNLDFLQWSQREPRRVWCPINEGVVSKAAMHGNFHILHWVLQHSLSTHMHLLCNMFAVSVAHQDLATLSLMASLGIQIMWPYSTQDLQALPPTADLSVKQLASSLTPAEKGDPVWQAVFKEALRVPLPPPSHLQGVASHCEENTTWSGYVEHILWLADLAAPEAKRTYTLRQLVECSGSIVPIQLATHGVGPVIPWCPSTHSLAGAHAPPPVLQWLQRQVTPKNLKVVQDTCPPARMLQLVEEHWWFLPLHMESYFGAVKEAEGRYLAMLSVVYQQRAGPLPCACLGSLPNALVRLVAQAAACDIRSMGSTYVPPVRPLLPFTMGFWSTTKLLAKHMLKYYKGS